MAAVLTTPAAHLSTELTPGIEAIELRSGPMVVTLREIAEGGVIVVATPAASFALLVEAGPVGPSYRATIRAKATS